MTEKKKIEAQSAAEISLVGVYFCMLLGEFVSLLIKYHIENGDFFPLLSKYSLHQSKKKISTEKCCKFQKRFRIGDRLRNLFVSVFFIHCQFFIQRVSWKYKG